MNIKWIGCNSNNFGVGRLNNKIDKIIVHWIDGTLSSCDATFQSPTRLASAHYGIGNGEIHQYVKEEDTAWHAGNLTINRQSIGIEHEGSPNITISEETYHTSAQLIRDLCNRYKIPLDRDHVKGHKEVSVKPTQCPGTLDIDKLINLAKGSDMITEEQKRILDFLQGKTEGDVRQAFGALNDLPTKDAQIATLSQKVLELDSFTKKLEEKITILSSEVEASNKVILDWQSKTNSANEQVGKATAQLNDMTDDRNKYRRLYETQLDKSVEKMTALELLLLGFKKLLVKSKK